MLRILVVEDDSDIRTAVCEGLREAGHAVVEVGDGQQGRHVRPPTLADRGFAQLFTPTVPCMDNDTCPIKVSSRIGDLAGEAAFSTSPLTSFGASLAGVRDCRVRDDESDTSRRGNSS